MRIEAQAKVGELLQLMAKNKGGGVRGSGSTAPTMGDVGIDDHESSRGQRIAAVPSRSPIRCGRTRDWVRWVAVVPKPGRSDSPARVYVETSVLSRLADYSQAGAVRLSQADKDALDHLCDRPSIEFVTSEKTLDEFRSARDPNLRLILKVVYKLTVKVRREPIQIPNAVIIQAARGSRIIAPASRPDPRFEALQRVFDPADAEHVFVARMAACDYLLTADAATILGRVARASKEARQLWTPLEIVSPAQLWAVVQGWPGT